MEENNKPVSLPILYRFKFRFTFFSIFAIINVERVLQLEINLFFCMVKCILKCVDYWCYRYIQMLMKADKSVLDWPFSLVFLVFNGYFYDYCLSFVSLFEFQYTL